MEHLIWFDFTTSMHWTRPAVGIVRAEQECCRWLLTKLKGRVRLCIYDASAGQFLELAEHEARQVLERGWANPEPDANASMVAPSVDAASAPAATPARLVRRVERLLRKAALALLDWVPRAHQPTVRGYLVACRRTAAFGYRELRSAHAEGVPGQTATMPVPAFAVATRASGRPLAKFRPGDTYVTLGLDWDYGGKLERLYSEKKKSGLKTLHFAYDVIPVKFPHYFPTGRFDLFSAYFANLGWTADRVLCISQCTARDLAAFLRQVGAPCPTMSVVRLGDALPATLTDEPSPEVASLLDRPFLLSVSTIEIRKNHESLYRAYLSLIESGFEVPTLVLVGMPGWLVDDFMYSLRNDPRVADKIVVLTHLSDADLATLYRNCLFTLYPSLYEGWGLPVAESLAFGKFCLASDVASIPEIAGDLIDYVSPWDVPQWATKIQLYCTDSVALRTREQLISSQFEITSWEQAADQVIAAIDDVVQADAAVDRDGLANLSAYKTTPSPPDIPRGRRNPP